MKKQKNPQQTELPGNTNESERVVKKTPFWLKLLFVVLALLVLLNTFQLWNFARMIGGLNQYSGGIVDEIGGVQGDLKQFGEDLNEIRRFLLLPEHDYAFGESATNELPNDEQSSSENELAMYKFLENFRGQKQLAEQKNLAIKQRDELIVDAALGENGIGYGEPSDDSENLFLKLLNNENSQAIFNVIWDLKNGEIEVQNVLENKVVAKLSDVNWKDSLKNYLLENKSMVIAKKAELESKIAEILGLKNDVEIAAIFAEKGIIINEVFSDQGDHLMFIVESVGSGSMMYIRLNKNDYSLVLDTEVADQRNGDKKFGTLAELKKALIEEMKNFVDPQVQMVEDRKSELKAIFEQEAFKELLRAQDLKIAEVPREESNKVLYDVVDVNGAVNFSFAIELSSGLLKVVQGDQEVDLLNFLMKSDEGSKKKP